MNRLKELRTEKGLTQQELADLVEVTKLTIANWENEKHKIKSDKAQQLADEFGVSVGYLLGYDTQLRQIQGEALEAVKKDEKSIKEAFSAANSVFETTTKGIYELIDLLMTGVKAGSLNSKVILETLDGIRTFVEENEKTVDYLIKYQAQYTADQLLKYKLEKAINRSKPN